MKIIFDSEKQKKMFLDALSIGNGCPCCYELDDAEECDKTTCRECWEQAIECEVAND